MFRIGICDDEKSHCERVRGFCDRFFEERAQKYEVLEFYDGRDVLAYDGKRIDLLFLDIEMGEISGLEVLNQLRRSDDVWRIVVVSSHFEERLNTIDTKTLAFLDKPVNYNGIEKCLDVAIRENRQNRIATFSQFDGKRNIELDDILYIQADRHYVSVNLKKGNFVGYDSLKQYEDQFQGTQVIRIHKSYMVNMYHIKKILSEEVIMEDGARIPIGRKYKSELKDTYYEFVRSTTYRRMDNQ